MSVACGGIRPSQLDALIRKNYHGDPPLFMGLIKCFDDRRSDRLWLMIPEICMSKNGLIHAQRTWI